MPIDIRECLPNLASYREIGEHFYICNLYLTIANRPSPDFLDENLHYLQTLLPLKDLATEEYSASNTLPVVSNALSPTGCFGASTGPQGTTVFFSFVGCGQCSAGDVDMQNTWNIRC